MIEIRIAEPRDWTGIAEIYNDAVLNSTATFDTEPLVGARMTEWFQRHGESFPIIVADDGEQIVGWASLSRYSVRPAYDITAEISFYVRAGHRGGGIGRRLGDDAIARARNLGFHSLIARVADESEASLHLFESFGFAKAGFLQEAGEKFGRRIGVFFLQKML